MQRVGLHDSATGIETGKEKCADAQLYAPPPGQAKREADDPLYGKGLRFCRCGADISHRSADQAYCEECVGNEWKRNQQAALRRELHQLHEMNPERWPADILAKRYQLPLEQVQRWVET